MMMYYETKYSFVSMKNIFFIFLVIPVHSPKRRPVMCVHVKKCPCGGSEKSILGYQRQLLFVEPGVSSDTDISNHFPNIVYRRLQH